MKYEYKYQLDKKHYKELPFTEYSEWELQCSAYVEKWLSPSIEHANCGWHHCTYYVLESESFGRSEYIALYPNEFNQDGRFINVSGGSLGAFAESVWDTVYAR